MNGLFYLSVTDSSRFVEFVCLPHKSSVSVTILAYPCALPTRGTVVSLRMYLGQFESCGSNETVGFVISAFFVLDFKFLPCFGPFAGCKAFSCFYPDRRAENELIVSLESSISSVDVGILVWWILGSNQVLWKKGEYSVSLAWLVPWHDGYSMHTKPKAMERGELAFKRFEIIKLKVDCCFGFMFVEFGIWLECNDLPSTRMRISDPHGCFRERNHPQMVLRLFGYQGKPTSVFDSFEKIVFSKSACWGQTRQRILWFDDEVLYGFATVPLGCYEIRFFCCGPIE